MAIVTCPQCQYPPLPGGLSSGQISISTSTMNASGDRVAFIVTCPKAGTLDRFEFRTGLVTNNPDNGIRLSFQTVNPANGDPDGTQSQFRDITGTLAASTWQVPGLMTSDGTDTGTKRTVAAGELLACVIDFVSFVASDSFQVQYLGYSIALSGLNSYVDDGSSGAYVKDSSSKGMLALRYNDGTYAEFSYGAWPIMTSTSTAFNSGSTPDERAIRCQVPFSMRALGVWIMVDVDNPCDIVVYDAGGGVVDTISLDPDIRATTTGGPYFCYFPNGPVTLTANSTYRISVKPTTGSNVTVFVYTVNSNGLLAAWPPGIEWYLSTRTDAGAWSDTTTSRILGGFIIDGVDGNISPPAAVSRAYPFLG